MAQGQSAKASLEPGEEALHRTPGHPVSGPAEAIGPATPGPPPPPGVLRYADPDAPPAQVTANLPGILGAISAQLLWPSPGPAHPAPTPQVRHQLAGAVTSWLLAGLRATARGRPGGATRAYTLLPLRRRKPPNPTALYLEVAERHDNGKRS
jgi:hypothetical protein